MRRALAPLAALVLALSLAACGSDGDDDDDVESSGTTTITEAEVTTTTGDSESATTTEAPATTVAPASCDPGTPPPDSTGADPMVAGQLNDVVAAASGCTDTMTFVFDSTVPGYSIGYQSPPFTEDASGEPVTIEGSAFIVLRLEPAYSYDFEANEPTYTGPREFMPDGLRYVREVEKTGDFEAVIHWIIGLSEPAAYTATVEGSSLVVTIGSPG